MENSEQVPAEDPLGENKKRKLSIEKKRYNCTFPGCTRDYSRAEHLYRHQLNREPHQVGLVMSTDVA